MGRDGDATAPWWHRTMTEPLGSTIKATETIDCHILEKLCTK
jgi:hypothetical protein